MISILSILNIHENKVMRFFAHYKYQFAQYPVQFGINNSIICPLQVAAQSLKNIKSLAGTNKVNPKLLGYWVNLTKSIIKIYILIILLDNF